MRLIIYLLILANIGFYAWHVYHPAEVVQSVRPVPTWPAGVKRLTLLTEHKEHTGHATPLSRPPKTAVHREHKAPPHIISSPKMPSKAPPPGAVSAGSAPAQSPLSSAGGASVPADGHSAAAKPSAAQPKVAPGSAGQARQTPAPDKNSKAPAAPGPARTGKGTSDGHPPGPRHSSGDSGPSSSNAPSAATGKVPATATDTAAAAPPSPSACYRVGPLANRAAAGTLKSRLTQQGLTVQVQKTQVTQPDDYWVFLPPMSHEEAVNISEDLADKGVKDYFVGKDNFISLGIFNGPRSAARRRQQIAELGYSPKIKKHLTIHIQYWLAVKSGTGTAISGATWSHLLAAAPGVQHKSVDCD